MFTRFHVPAGKAIALAAMPTAVLMGMGFTPTLANAEDQPSSRSLTADEYKECVAALEDESASPSPSASQSEDPGTDETAEPTPTPSATSNDGSSSPDSGSDDETAEPESAPTPTPTPSASPSKESNSAPSEPTTPAPAPSASESEDGNVLEQIGDAITGIFRPGEEDTSSASPAPSPTPSASETPAADEKDTSDPVQETTGNVPGKVTGTVEDTVKDTAETAEDTTEAVQEEASEAADEATATPSPSASATLDPEDCPVATDERGGVDNTVPLPDDPWQLNASSLLLKGAKYEGIVKVRTANGTTKDVLKYVIHDGTDIGDLHQTVRDPQAGKTYHVQAASGSTSTIRDGETVMYTESISGNLLGLIPVTFDPKHPPPLDIPIIYFTKVKVVQAGQFGGTLHVPGLHQFVTD
nr:hypothetical protein [Streptomyces sp. TRM68416]